MSTFLRIHPCELALNYILHYKQDHISYRDIFNFQTACCFMLNICAVFSSSQHFTQLLLLGGNFICYSKFLSKCFFTILTNFHIRQTLNNMQFYSSCGKHSNNFTCTIYVVWQFLKFSENKSWCQEGRCADVCIEV